MIICPNEPENYRLDINNGHFRLILHHLFPPMLHSVLFLVVSHICTNLTKISLGTLEFRIIFICHLFPLPVLGVLEISYPHSVIFRILSNICTKFG
jgi:hypothetical protein